MSEKKPIKVSLGTTICVFIIILLVIALIVMYCYYNKKENKPITNNTINNTNANNNVIVEQYKNVAEDKGETVLENWPNIDTTKIINPGEGYKYSQESRNGNLYTISEDKRSITIDYTKEKITGFVKNIDSACISYLGQGSLDFYVFLYEDGTVGYTTQNDNGKIKEFTELSGIIKIAVLDYTRKIEWDNGEMIDFSESTIIAIDNAGNIYDLGLLR